MFRGLSLILVEQYRVAMYNTIKEIKMIKMNCLNCGNVFLQREAELNRKKKSKNRGKFCSLSCSTIFGAKERRKRRVLNVTCSYCGEKFYKNKSKMEGSKSKLYFCCRKHKDMAQRLEFGLEEIQPDRYGNGDFAYRDLVLRNKENKCPCGFDFKPLLVVHHKDSNRSNNAMDNLEILCTVCHGIRHMKFIDGEWKYSYKYLTPRDKIKEIENIVFK